MKDLWKYLIIGCSVIVSVIVLAFAVTYYGRQRDVISVTGLGETVFESDMIVWRGRISLESSDKLAGYRQMEQNQKKVLDYLLENGVAESEVTFSFINTSKNYVSLYSESGNYMGARFVGYSFKQTLTINSRDVEKIERVSREISSLVAQGVDIDSDDPEYYYTKLDDLKIELIEKASSDAYTRAKSIAKNAGAHLGKASSARLGVFQITSATGEEEYSYGGTFNTWSKEKKARITVRMEYRLK